MKVVVLPRTQTVHGLLLAARGALAPGMPVLLVAVAVYLGLFFRLGDFPLFDVDEGAFGEATREMLERGDFVSTWLNGAPRFDKPILTYWLQAASVTVLGQNEFALRLPSALAGTAWIVALAAFTRRFAGSATGCAAGLIAASSLGVTLIGRGATADALLNLFLALAMFDCYRYLEEPRVRYRRRVWLWMAFGALAKGPVALLIPGGGSLIVFGLRGQFRRWAGALRDPAGWLILLAVAGPWYWLEYQRQGLAFIEGFFLHHNVERFAEPLQGHDGWVLYYLPVALLLLLPYTGLFLRLLRSAFARLPDELETFLWCWFLFVLVFFSLAQTQLPHYLMYGITPLFVLMARHRHVVGSALLAFAPPVMLLGFVALLPALMRVLGPGAGNLYLSDMLTQADVFSSGWQQVAWGMLAAVLALAMMPRTPVWPRLAASGLICSSAVGGLALPSSAALQQGPVKEAALLARASGWQVQTWHINVPSFSFYRGSVTGRADVLRAGDVILTRSDELAGLGRVQVLYRKGGVVLARIDA